MARSGRSRFPPRPRPRPAAGFRGISVYAREYQPGMRPLLDGLGLAVAEVDGPMAWLPGQPGPEPGRFLEIAAELGARWCNVLEMTLQPPEPGLAADAFADVVVFLASDMARYVTGHCIPVDGGTLAASDWYLKVDGTAWPTSPTAPLRRRPCGRRLTRP